MYDTLIPDWEKEKMPKPQALVTKSWEDFYPSAQVLTQNCWKRNPTPQEIKDIFDECDDFDCEYGTYWSTIDAVVERYYEDFCSKCGLEDCKCDD